VSVACAIGVSVAVSVSPGSGDLQEKTQEVAQVNSGEDAGKAETDNYLQFELKRTDKSEKQ